MDKNNVVYDTTEYYSAVKIKKFEGKIELEGTLLSEVALSQEDNAVCSLSHVDHTLNRLFCSV